MQKNSNVVCPVNLYDTFILVGNRPTARQNISSRYQHLFLHQCHKAVSRYYKAAS